MLIGILTCISNSLICSDADRGVFAGRKYENLTDKEKGMSATSVNDENTESRKTIDRDVIIYMGYSGMSFYEKRKCIECQITILSRCTDQLIYPQDRALIL